MVLSYKGFGSAMIITGTSIGAGMLAIPATVAGNGFWLATILLIVTWFIMMQSALLLADVNLTMENGTNFSRMAQITLGKIGKNITSICYLLLLYSLTAAYSASGGNLIASGLKMLGIQGPDWLNSFIFVLILGIFVYIGTTAVDHANKVLLLLKVTTFFGFIIVILPFVKASYLNTKTPNFNYIWVTFPILSTSFSFQHIIPTLRTYLDSNRKELRRAIIVGSIIPLIIYIIWAATTLGSIPLFGKNSFHDIIKSNNITTGIVSSYHSHLVSKFVYIFEAVATTTSFLGVTLGLFDFNRDTYELKKRNSITRIIVFIITFLPPLLFAIFYPDGFRIALGYASIFVAVLLVGIPTAMAWIIRNRTNTHKELSKLYLSFMFIIAATIITLEVGTLLNCLPTL